MYVGLDLGTYVIGFLCLFRWYISHVKIHGMSNGTFSIVAQYLMCSFSAENLIFMKYQAADVQSQTFSNIVAIAAANALISL